MYVELSDVGFVLIIIGFLASLIGMFILMFGESRRSVKTYGGGVIFIGPFPIIFGSDRKFLYIALFIMFLFFLIYVIVLFVGF
ncbi:MAG: TIGR00304 family membrane protein [Candidatus Asgardarchaeia archaeon]